MLVYFSKTPGIGGLLKKQPEDFTVEEILEDGTILELNKKIELEPKKGKFSRFILQKTNWSTADAIKQIARKLHVGPTRFNFSGTKDKRAVTTQLCSVMGFEPQQLLGIKIKDIKINGAWQHDSKINLGEHVGNRFTIRISGSSEDEKKVIKIYQELGGKFPNYFGEQRFGGTRKNTHLIGQKIIKRDFEGAVLDFLTEDEGEENVEAKEARKNLRANCDIEEALIKFPMHLRLERTVLGYLKEKPGDYIGVLKNIPRNIALMFVHAFQSQVFNEVLSQRIKEHAFEIENGDYYCAENSFGFPDVGKKIEDKKIKENKWLVMKIIGHETFELSDREFDVLEKYDVMPRDFKIKELPELSSKGTVRTMFSLLKDFSFKKDTFKFSLTSGAYATSALREFIDEKK